MVLKFHDDPTVDQSEIIVFLRQIWWSAGKREGFVRRMGKTKMRKRRGTVSVKTDLILFIARFTLFIYLLFYNKNSILFSIKHINKIPFFYFLSNPNVKV